jgi:hypothetical protein
VLQQQKNQIKFAMFTAWNNLNVDKANDNTESELTKLRCDSVLKGIECKLLLPTYLHFDFQKLFNLPAKYVESV